jgi:hypothetical protein
MIIREDDHDLQAEGLNEHLRFRVKHHRCLTCRHHGNHHHRQNDEAERLYDNHHHHYHHHHGDDRHNLSMK